MRRLASTVLLLALASAYGAAKDETAELKAPLESARPEERPELCIRIARQQLRNADKLYSEGKFDHARDPADDIVTYSENTHDAATQTNKHLTTLEIDFPNITTEPLYIR